MTCAVVMLVSSSRLPQAFFFRLQKTYPRYFATCDDLGEVFVAAAGCFPKQMCLPRFEKNGNSESEDCVVLNVYLIFNQQLQIRAFHHKQLSAQELHQTAAKAHSLLYSLIYCSQTNF